MNSFLLPVQETGETAVCSVANRQKRQEIQTAGERQDVGALSRTAEGSTEASRKTQQDQSTQVEDELPLGSRTPTKVSVNKVTRASRKNRSLRSERITKPGSLTGFTGFFF